MSVAFFGGHVLWVNVFSLAAGEVEMVMVIERLLPTFPPARPHASVEGAHF